MTTLGTFRARLLDAKAPVPDGLSDGKGGAAGRRYGVYRNNVAVALRDALRAGFPILDKLIGAENFDMLAGVFLRAHPPTSPLMMHYGAEMPVFLEGFGPLQHIGYLSDVARLEIALRQSYHAADAPVLDPARLGALTPEALSRTILHLAPSLRLIRSPWPLWDIWRFNTVADAPKPRASPQCVLIIRHEFDPEPHLITRAGADWIRAVQAGETLGQAHDAALVSDPTFDLGPLLALLIQNDALTDLTTKD